MSFLDFAAIKQQVSVRSAIDLLGLRLTEHQSQWRGPCPTCKSGGDRALVVTPSKNAFYCFAAHTGGDVIALASHIRSVGMKEAAAFLAGDSAASEIGTAPRTGNGQNKLPEERPKEDVRSLKPLGYLEPDHESLRAIGLEGRPAAISVQVMRPKASCAASSPFQSMIGGQAISLPIADLR